MGLSDFLAAEATRPATTRPTRLDDEILPSLTDVDRAALVAALESNMVPGRIVAALRAEGIRCSEGAIRYWREQHDAS